MSAYEKEQTRNILRNHLVMISCGFKTPLPCFITNFEARQLNNLASIEPCEDNPSGSKQNRKGYPGHVLSSKGEVPLKIDSGAPQQSTRVPKPKQSVKIVRPDSEGLPKRGPGRPRKSGAKNPSSKPTKRPKQDVQGKTRNQPPRRSKSKCRVFIKRNFQSNRKQRKR